MKNTKRQNKRERFAKLCDDIAGEPSEGARQLRAINRRVDIKKAQRRKEGRG